MRALLAQQVGAVVGVQTEMGGETGLVGHNHAVKGDVVTDLDGLRGFAAADKLDPYRSVPPVSIQNPSSAGTPSTGALFATVGSPMCWRRWLASVAVTGRSATVRIAGRRPGRVDAG